MIQDLSLSARHSPVPTIIASPSPVPAVPPPPTNSQIEAAIQKAQQMSARSTPDGRNSSLGRDTRMQLFVGNVSESASHHSALTTVQLPYRVRWQDLKDLFRKAGTVLRADVSLGPDNRSRGFVCSPAASSPHSSHQIRDRALRQPGRRNSSGR